MVCFPMAGCRDGKSRNGSVPLEELPSPAQGSVRREKLPGAAEPEFHKEMSREKGHENDKQTCILLRAQQNPGLAPTYFEGWHKALLKNCRDTQ